MALGAIRRHDMGVGVGSKILSSHFICCVELIASWNILCQIVKCGGDGSYSDFVWVQSVDLQPC